MTDADLRDLAAAVLAAGEYPNALHAARRLAAGVLALAAELADARETLGRVACWEEPADGLRGRPGPETAGLARAFFARW